VAQRINSSRWCLRSQVRSYPVLAFYVFSCSISPENSGSIKNRRCKTCIYPALIREIFSRRGPLSSGVIMCMYGNFTVRLVTVYDSAPRPTPPSLPSRQRVASLSQSSCMPSIELTDGRGGEGMGEEPNHTTSKKPGLLKSFSTLWSRLFTMHRTHSSD
jgi:hypothetical protein